MDYSHEVCFFDFTYPFYCCNSPSCRKTAEWVPSKISSDLLNILPATLQTFSRIFEESKLTPRFRNNVCRESPLPRMSLIIWFCPVHQCTAVFDLFDSVSSYLRAINRTSEADVISHVAYISKTSANHGGLGLDRDSKITDRDVSELQFLITACE